MRDLQLVSLMHSAAWADILSKEKSYLELSDIPKANDASIKKHKRFGKLFDETSVPDHIEGFELKNPGEVHKLFPEGTDAAKHVSIQSASRKSSKLIICSCLIASCILNPEKLSSKSFPLSQMGPKGTISTPDLQNTKWVETSSMVITRRS